MKSAKFLDDKKVIERGVMALHKELGPIEASRFIAITGVKHQDSVGEHRKWQESLNPDIFIKDVLNEYKK